MGDVTLGLPGSWAADNQEASDHYTTKVGGLPDWPFPRSSLAPELLQCNTCRNTVCLIAQVYAPITTATVKIEERVIYIFGCTDLHCGSWRAIRVQKPDKVEEINSGDSERSQSTISDTSTSVSKWWDDLHSFEPESEESGEKDGMDMQDLARALSEAATLASGSGKGKTKKKAKRKTEISAQPHQLADPPLPHNLREPLRHWVLPCFYLYYQEDRFNNKLAPVVPVPGDDDDINQEETWEKENYEYDKALHADRTYLKFKKKIDGCPKQCLRYSFGGKPLLATGVVSESRSCNLCGESRHYEMQLMPPLVYFLLEGATGVQRELLDNWNWMTLMVYTCSKSCFQKSDQEITNRNGWTVVEETIIAQFE
ncbi:putative 20S rRNA accumulation protein 4 [Silene latifolia]|uniref:putative 20S rRNA accumulation protein 4 n=1 Tax=Silene latifolia TaxID=37657 RepID=UPI003D785EB2